MGDAPVTVDLFARGQQSARINQNSVRRDYHLPISVASQALYLLTASVLPSPGERGGHLHSIPFQRSGGGAPCSASVLKHYNQHEI